MCSPTGPPIQPQGDDKIERDAEVQAGDDVQMEAKEDEEEDAPPKKKKKDDPVWIGLGLGAWHSARGSRHRARRQRVGDHPMLLVLRCCKICRDPPLLILHPRLAGG